ncbi:taste receptor type 2 member 7-like [Dromiciops gliroides]|uniref:taste receptor type 2 member 7-like n=1 Tax=Dromiciops gliroides TaxID=33562 RepID=UPI001CC6103E|nr:taste receptor type 2 member 7-like [Dromiciops gliroides]
MTNVLENICLIVIAVEAIVGIWINGFIGLVKCIDWAKSRKLSLVDFILMSLAFSRMCLLWIMLVDGVMRVLYRDSYITSENMKITGHLWVMTNNSSVSFVTCLNAYYFLKIAHFSHPVFLWLKWRINRVVFTTLLGSLIIYLFLTLPIREKFKDDLIGNMERKEKNHTKPFQMKRFQFIVAHILLYLGPLILLIITMISCFLLILSLWRHTWQMQLNATGSRDPSTEAHRRVIKWMVFLLFLVLLYHLGISITILSSSMLEEILGIAMAGLYPSSHSLILILENSKLRRASLWVWKQALFCCRGGKA